MITTIELEQEQLNKIVRDDLQNMLDSLTDDLKRINRSKKGSIFTFDYKEDKKIIKDHIKAFKLILKYYGG